MTLRFSDYLVGYRDHRDPAMWHAGYPIEREGVHRAGYMPVTIVAQSRAPAPSTRKPSGAPIAATPARSKPKPTPQPKLKARPTVGRDYGVQRLTEREANANAHAALARTFEQSRLSERMQGRAMKSSEQTLVLSSEHHLVLGASKTSEVNEQHLHALLGGKVPPTHDRAALRRRMGVDKVDHSKIKSTATRLMLGENP